MSAVEWITAVRGIDARLTRLAATTYGVFTFQQAGRVGITPQDLHQKAADEVIEEFDDQFVYRHLATPGPWYKDFYRERWLLLYPSQFPDERTGLYQRPRELITGLWALSLQTLVPTYPRGSLLFTAPPPRLNPSFDTVVHPIRLNDWTWIDGLPVTRPAVAVADMVLAFDDEEDITSTLREAIRGGEFHIPRFIELVAPVAEQYGEVKGNGRALFNRLLGSGTTWVSRDEATTTITRDDDTVTVTSLLPIFGRF